MTAVQPKPEPTAVGETFDSLSPATDEVVGTYPVHSAEDVCAAVERGRVASEWWDGLGFAGRAERLRQWKGVLTRRLPQLCQVVRDETGKPVADAQLECVLAIEHIAWAGKHARKVLGRQRRSAGLLMSNQAATVEYRPLGVVGVIGPWNYPVFTPLGSIVYALAAGNAVVFKPSEYTPGVGRWLVDAFAEIVPEQPVLQLVTGFGETGAALVGAGVDKIAFTGSAATGKKIMAAAARTLTPVVIEAGGKDRCWSTRTPTSTPPPTPPCGVPSRTRARPASASSARTSTSGCTTSSWPRWWRSRATSARARTRTRSTARSPCPRSSG